MELLMVLRTLLVLAFMSAGSAAAHQDPLDDPTTELVLRLEQAAATGDPHAILALAIDPHDGGVRAFASASTVRSRV